MSIVIRIEGFRIKVIVNQNDKLLCCITKHLAHTHIHSSLKTIFQMNMSYLVALHFFILVHYV